MSRGWYYTCGGLIFGPVSAAELRQAAASGILGPSDLVWPKGGGRVVAALAGDPRAAPALPVPAPAPDWLADVGPAVPQARAAAAELPDWIEDVRRCEAAAPVARPAADRGGTPARPGGEPAVLTPPATGPGAVPLARRVATPVPDPLGQIPLARRVEAPVPAPAGEGPSSPAGIPNAARPEAPEAFFEAARRALRRWVDADANRPFVVTGDLEALHQFPALRQLFGGARRYGQETVDRLRRHLAFLVDNRRKFFAAGGA
jgi:hypothetical protein